MRGNEFLDKMALVDPDFVEAADAEPKAKKPNRKIWIPIAACLCLLLVGTPTVLAATGLGTKLIGFIKKNGESGYELSADIIKFPAKDLKGEIREVPGLIRQQFESYEPYMSVLPGYWQRTFETRDEAIKYVGFKKLKSLKLNAEEKQTALYVHGTENGDIISVSVETFYMVGDVRLFFFADVYTENEEGEITISAFTTENTEFSESFYTTKKGKTLQIIDQSALQSGYLTKEGYLVVDGVLYHLHTAYKENDAAQAEKLLKEWADLF